MAIPTRTLHVDPRREVRRDGAVWAAVDAERARQEAQLELIASENHTSREVIAAMGTVLTNKYAEGYPGRRYYGGCEHVDVVEDAARASAPRRSSARTHANVQPHSGTQANIAALMALRAARATRVLAMSLDHGGHLSHGHPKNFSGVFYEFHSYGVERESERIDMDAVRDAGARGAPEGAAGGRLGLLAHARLRRPSRAIAREVGALLLVDMAHIAGLVAARRAPEPRAARRRRRR